MHRLLLVVLRALCLIVVIASVTPRSLAQSLEVDVFPFTGEVQLRNPTAFPVEFVYYSIQSDSSSLNGSDGVWLSIADMYDVSGNGFIDPTNEWVELASGPGDLVEQLAEGAPLGTGGVLQPFRGVTLGNVLATPYPGLHDLTFEFLQEDETPVPFIVKETIAGNYNTDRKVDNADYTFWKNAFGLTFTPFADGNLNGIVDAADYTTWRDHLGQDLATLGLGSASSDGGAASAVAVPEPAAIATVFGILGGLSVWRLGRRRSREAR